MRAIIDSQTGRVLATGGDSLAAAAGQEAVDDDALDHAAIAALDGPGVEVWWDTAARQLKARARVPTAADVETTARQQALAQIDAAIANWDQLSAAQVKAAALLNLRATRAIAKRLLQE